MDILVSIVVPIYNVEMYLCECIESILKQSYKKIEIILVDDGSMDKSGAVCDHYAAIDHRVRVIHQKNGGLTVARRVGVNAANGQYVGFVDGDDWIEPHMYETLLSYAVEKSADIVTSSGYREYAWGRSTTERLGDTVKEGLYEVSSDDTFLLRHIFSSAFSSDSYINGAVWNKLFRTQILCDVLNEMDDRVNGFMDDNVCVLGAALNSECIYVSHDILYHHREREDAFSYAGNQRGFEQINHAYLDMKRMLENSPYYGELYPLLCEHTSSRLLLAYNCFFELPEFTLPEFYFRSERIGPGKKVVLYGAGHVGKSFIRQFLADGKYELVGVADQKESHMIKPADLCNVRFDYCIIAVLKENMALGIKNALVGFGVEPEKIVWEKPITLFEYYFL